MSVDSVQPILNNHLVNPGPEAHGDRKQDSQHDKPPQHQEREKHEQADPQPVLNYLGQVTGQTINITA